VIVIATKTHTNPKPGPHETYPSMPAATPTVGAAMNRYWRIRCADTECSASRPQGAKQAH